jgi:VWFA-related protein
VRIDRLPLLCLACLFCVLAAFAFSKTPRQQGESPRTQRPTFQVQSNLVVVDLTVRDKKGNLVADLTSTDFKVYEDNIAQEIVTFSAENIPMGPAAAVTAGGVPEAVKPSAPMVNLGLNPDIPPKKEDLQDKRLVILFFDLSSLGNEDLIRSVDTAHDFISKQAGPQDLVAVATYSSILQLVQDFTNDRDVLLKTLDALASPDSGDTPPDDLSDPDTSDDVFVPDTVQFDIFNTDRRLAALETLAKMYREFPERKSLIYFSSGVRTTGVENNAQIRSTVDNANRSNLSIYTVDSRGLVALPPGGAASQKSPGGRALFSGSAMMRQRSNLARSQETLTTLAHDTGGRSFQDSNDLSLAIKQIQKDTQTYYVLGYFSTNPKEDGRYRKIRVEVTQPNLKVEHRPGYFAAKSFGQLNQQERDLQLQQAMSVDRPFSDVPLILQADYFRKDDKNSLVPVSIMLDGDGIIFADQGNQKEARLEFLAQVTDAKGRVTGVGRDAVQVRLPAERAERIKAGGIFYATDFELKAGDYKLKFLVRDNGTGKLGSFEQMLSVPAMDVKKLDTSSIILGNRLMNAGGDGAAGVVHKGSMRKFQALGAGYDPLVTGDKKIIPSIGNVFRNGQTVHVYFQVYGAAASPRNEKPAIETYLMLLKDNARILESQPQLVQDWTKERGSPGGGRGALLEALRGRGGRGPGGAAGSTMADRKGEATVAISLPLKTLKKGTYTLQIHVRDLIADVNLFRRVPIVIQ